MDLHLEGKVVILTGGFKGIGKGIALRLAKEGAIVAVINRDDGAAEQFAAEMKAITDNYRTYLMDLNDTDDIAPIVEDVVKTTAISTVWSTTRAATTTSTSTTPRGANSSSRCTATSRAITSSPTAVPRTCANRRARSSISRPRPR